MLTQPGYDWWQTPGLAPFPDLTQPEVAYPLYQQLNIEPRFIARLEVRALALLPVFTAPSAHAL